MRRAALLAAGLAFAFVALAPPASAARDDEDRLRRRVKRFYVLNYLNRYGEMWEMFSADLRERLGDDRQAYVKTSRNSGFELYESRIEEVELKGAVASVEVVLRAQLAGSLDLSSRRHRMLWRFEDGDWRYAGSVDVTHVLDEDAERRVELQPPGRARAPEVPEDNLLPPRVRVRPSEPDESEPREESRSAEGERWDLVAVPPPGRSAPGERPAEAEAPSEAGAGSPREERPAAGTAPPAKEAARARPAAAPEAEEPVRRAELLPPERASAPPTPPRPAPDAHGRRPRYSDADYEKGTRMLRKAVSGLLPRRIRALEALRRLDDPRLAALMARALPEAPAGTAEVFLDEIARHDAWKQAEAVAAALDRDEPEVRAAAADALRRLGATELAPRLARAAREETLDGPRAEALRAHAELAGAAAEPLLTAALADPEAGPRTLRAAALAAGRCGCPALGEPLRSLARRTGFEEAAAAALHAAGRLGDEGSLAFLEEIAEGRLRLPAQAGGELDGALEARRGLALSGLPGAGEALAATVLERGMRAGSEDAVLVAGTGELGALLALLEHPVPALRRRAADLVGRVVESEADSRRALEAIAEALVDENDPVAFDALLDARSRLGEAGGAG